MAQPSSSHHRERERERSHHHHRTISSTTLLLVLSLILAVLAVMLSIPNTQGVARGEGSSSGVWNYLSPKRSQVLVAREHSVAQREAEVARREAELLAGNVNGVPACSCPPIPSATATPQVFVEQPVQTVIKEVVKEVEALAPPSWFKDAGPRVEELLDREAKVAEREKDIGRREESIGRRETDVSRRETWIMEQLIALNNERAETVEEEIIYEAGGPRRKTKELPPVIAYTETETRTKVVTETLPPVTQVEVVTEIQTVTVPPAAHTRVAARPAPEEHIPKGPATQKIKPTTAVEVVKEEVVPTQEVVHEEEVVEEIVEDEYEDPRGRERTVTIVKRPKATRRPKQRSWFGGKW